MKQRLVFLFSIHLLLFTFCIANGTRIAVIPWGTGDSQLGLQSGPELEPVGPLSFAIDSSDSVYFLDSINKRISEFDSKGAHLKVIGNNIIGNSIAITDDGTIGILNNKEVQILDSKASIQRISIPTSIELTEGYGQHLRLFQGDFYATQINQHAMKVTQHSVGKFKAVETNAPNAELLGFRSNNSNQTYTVEWKSNTLAVVKRSDGKEVNLTTSDAFGGLQVIGVDKSGNGFVEAERITKDNYVHLEIYKVSMDGNGISKQEIPNKYATTIYKKTELLSDGSVLQVVTTKEGVEIWKWEL